MNKTNIRFSTNILKRLGEELNPDLTQGLIELVKNAYDADAKECIIEFKNMSDKNVSDEFSKISISIIDDGEGMTDSDIVDSWLLLGESKKTINKRTKLDRITVGNKGLGRLSALRLGKKVTLKTIHHQFPAIRYSLEIDWTTYETAKAVEDIELNIHQEVLSEDFPSGTEILIEDIERKISAYELKKFARALVLLANPFSDDKLGFKPILKLDNFYELERLVEQRHFIEAEFHTIAIIKNNELSVVIKDWLGNQLYNATLEDICYSTKMYQTPDAVLELWVFDFENLAFSARPVIKADIKLWLKEFGGIHLYYNGLRVSPYGDKQEKWLDDTLKHLSIDRKKSNLIGRLYITDNFAHLKQTTDRHGFIENTAFAELKRFSTDIFNWMAKCWTKEKNKKLQLESESLEKNTINKNLILDKMIKNISNLTERKAVEKATEDLKRSFKDRENRLKREIQLYRTLSTAGITTAVFAHESKSNPVKTIGLSITTIEDRCKELIKANIYEEKLNKPIKRIKKANESLNTLSNIALGLVAYGKRKNSQINIHSSIEDTIELFYSFIEGRETEIIKNFTNDTIPYVYASHAALESVFVNLFNNSLVAFENKNIEQRKILIYTKIVPYNYKKNISKLGIEIHVLDNGTGIEGIHLDDIWLAGETTKEMGTGLGLAIVKSTIQDMGGQVEAIAKNEMLGGAEIIITLPILGD